MTHIKPEFKQGGLKDVKDAVRLEKLCFSSYWKQEECEGELLHNPFSHLYLVYNEGKAIGYAFVWHMFENASIARIGIDPAYRKLHIGSDFLKYLLEDAKKKNCEMMNLECRKNNAAALALYTKEGFEVLREVPNYYPDGTTALIMSRSLI